MDEVKLDKFIVKENGHEMEVIIPQSGDFSYDRYLHEAEEEKTRDQLRKREPKRESKISKQDIAQLGRELLEYKNRKRESQNRKYF